MESIEQILHVEKKGEQKSGSAEGGSEERSMESGEVGGKKHEIKSISLRVESGKNLNERIECEDKMKKGVE